MIVTVPPALARGKSLVGSQPPARSRITIPIPVLSPPVFHNGERLTPPPYVAAPSTGNFEGITGGIDSLPAPELADSRVLVDPRYSADSQSRQIGGDLQLAHAITPVLLPYPEAAKRFRITGRVILHALVDEQGKVRYVRALSGPALLVDAAVRAISKEIFAPAILDGRATTCDLLVVVNFSLL
jgi:outer membrane biosynthesis protein TonB